MPKFKEAGKAVLNALKMGSVGSLIAKRYLIKERLGRGSFGMVYLVLDKKCTKGEELKVLKEISVGNLEPNETVQANLEAQLLSKLDHPAIVKFYSSFVEQFSFCIITEYCEGRDLQCKIEEYKQAGKTFPESQIIEWFIQLLLGAQYMHERRILHRDLKSNNIFLKNNIVKIGDFGVSRLLMGSCDLATTFTGTPYYMSPEILSHQGYDSKSDIWSLGCILYELCCLQHAFTGHNFMSIVLKIVEGETPSLPDHFSRNLNAILTSMLQKSPSHRPAAAEILKIPYIDQQLQNIRCKFSNISMKDKTISSQKEALQIKKALQLAEEKYQENHHRMQQLRNRNFQQVSVDVLHESHEYNAPQANQTQPVSTCDVQLSEQGELKGNRISDRLCMSEPPDHAIPEDPDVAEEFYHEDGFESCSDENLEMEEFNEENECTTVKSHEQDTDIEALVRCMEDVLDSRTLDGGTVISAVYQGPTAINCTMAQAKMHRMREAAIQKLEADLFQRIYDYLKKARSENTKEVEVMENLERLGAKPSDCFEVDQLLYFEEQLQSSSAAAQLLNIDDSGQ
ncbi:serine/threonine-protein kinase Nek11 isoform X2 [Hypanus sabinus]|uniref:serine/threonine-protein kinase Nek11 isoform X2 n=1 Tax=Hypanus sabinus TaxID=79690 RepID=UPI0028C4AFD2|nr:serine/threonine-protein kinase Nek11 isoform X2 [Hypanus sabinus]